MKNQLIIFVLMIVVFITGCNKQEAIQVKVAPDPQTFTINITENLTLGDLVSRKGFTRNSIENYTNALSDVFVPCPVGQFEVKIVNFNESLSAETVRERLASMNLVEVSIPVLIHFSIQYPNEQLTKNIVSLKSVNDHFAFLGSDSSDKKKGKVPTLSKREGRFTETAWFLALPVDSPLAKC